MRKRWRLYTKSFIPSFSTVFLKCEIITSLCEAVSWLLFFSWLIYIWGVVNSSPWRGDRLQGFKLISNLHSTQTIWYSYNWIGATRLARAISIPKSVIPAEPPVENFVGCFKRYSADFTIYCLWCMIRENGTYWMELQDVLLVWWTMNIFSSVYIRYQRLDTANVRI